MTDSELAFLALGLVLGAAAGAAIFLTFGNRLSRREIRVTVTRDAVPRRSGTLSQDAFLTSPSEPARGGPGDRRQADRSGEGQAAGGDAGVPWHRPMPEPERTPLASPDRTLVPSRSGAVGIAIEPEVDKELHDLRRRRAMGSPLERMLRGEHLAMVETVDAVAGPDSVGRRAWEVLLGGLVDSMAAVAVRESVIDFPMGTAFWDSFTVEQCRRIVAALASAGYQYDGVAGWVANRVPTYRDLTVALADVGVEPRRVRAWPNQSDIATLFVGARPAPEELLGAAGPEYERAQMQVLLGEHAASLDDLWSAWDQVKPLLLDERTPQVTVELPAEG